MYKQTADKGDVDEMYNLGICYEDGTGVKQDWGKALHLLRRAAEQGDAHAITHLSDLSLSGKFESVGYSKDILRSRQLQRQLRGKLSDESQTYQHQLKKLVREHQDENMTCHNKKCGKQIPSWVDLDEDEREAFKSHIKICSACVSVFYCCKECQVVGWPTHREKCATLAAARQAAMEKASTGCAGCGTMEGKLCKCSGCRKVQYCSRECQGKDWKRHKPACKVQGSK